MDSENLQEVDAQGADEASISRNAAMISVLVVISRITGFLRTWAQARALGITMMASCYAIANNLPNQLYELVVGGMLVTAFLPVYLSERSHGGRRQSNAYASNLSSLIVVFMGIATIACIAFAMPLVYTQSFSAQSDFDMDLTTMFFRFFAIEIMFYSLSSVFSGVLNAEREYVWSSVAPIANNVITIASFVIYGALATSAPRLALIILALGNPLGVLAQVLIQLPAMSRRGIRIRPYINFHDPALKDTLSIGVPSLVVMLSSFVTVSVMNSSALSVTSSGASVIYYARLWYTLPYSVLAVPITTTMFTELSLRFSKEDTEGFCAGVKQGIVKIMFTLVPFALFLIVFSTPLTVMLSAGSFGEEGVALTAYYLAMLSLSLPPYGVCMYFQKVFSAMREMRVFAAASIAAGVVQVILCLACTRFFGIGMVAFSSFVFFMVVDLISLVYLRRKVEGFRMGDLVAPLVRSLVFGGMGSAAGMGAMWALGRLMGPIGESIVHALVWTVVGGVLALVFCYGAALALHAPEAGFIGSLLHRGRPAGAGQSADEE